MCRFLCTDDVFDENSNTQHLYDQFARPIVEATVNGINGTIFAYGQTASGKTYTIMGNKSSPGIIPLAIHNIFNLVKLKSDRDFLIRFLSFFYICYLFIGFFAVIFFSFAGCHLLKYTMKK